MQIPMDAVLDGMGFDENGSWHNSWLMDFWRWAFSDLRDHEIKSVAADLITKLLLGTAPATMTAQELHLLRMSGMMAASTYSPGEVGLGCDA